MPSIPSSLDSWLSNPIKKPPLIIRKAEVVSFDSPLKPYRSPLESIDNSSHSVPTPPPSNYDAKVPNFGKVNLETITEHLGCESGVFYDVGDFLIWERRETERKPMARKEKKVLSEFPPPITTLRGLNPMSMLSRRENGRCLLVPFKCKAFEAERKDGRLQLRSIPDMPFTAIEEAEEQESGSETGNLVMGIDAKARGSEYREEGFCDKYARGRCKEGRGILSSDALWVGSS